MSATRTRLVSLALWAVAGSAPLATQVPCTLGVWEPPFDHGGMRPSSPACAVPAMAFPPADFEAIHMSLIPKGPHQGHVMVWNHLVYQGTGTGQTRVITYAIVDVVAQQFWNHVVCLAPDQGDLFCAGHAWNGAGDLVIAGGTKKHGNPFGGARLLYVWTPPTTLGAAGTWTAGPLLDVDRWYPSLIVLGPDPGTDRDNILVLGGSDPANSFAYINSYQCWTPTGGAAGSWQPGTLGNTFPGPQVTGTELGDYPRAHFLSTKEIGTAGMISGTAVVDHFAAPGVWPISRMSAMSTHRVYGSSVLFPITPGGGVKDYAVAVAGKTATGSALATAEAANLGVAGNPAWILLSPLQQPRWLLNTVLLPDSTVLAVGGEQQYANLGCSEVPALVPEIFAGGSWLPMQAGPIVRDYHSTALLLPDAKVLTASGESRHYGPWPNCANQAGRTPVVFPADYQVFAPPSVACPGTRPLIQNQAPLPQNWWVWSHNSAPVVTHAPLPFGVQVAKVALVRAGSVTHYADPNQRCVELPFTILSTTDPVTQVQVGVPTKASYLLPRGFYMLFLVTNAGVPSKAAWVQVQ